MRPLIAGGRKSLHEKGSGACTRRGPGASTIPPERWGHPYNPQIEAKVSSFPVRCALGQPVRGGATGGES